MSLDADMTPLEAGRELSERVMPGLETALAKKYDDLLPGFSEWQIGTVYGGVYASTWRAAGRPCRTSAASR